MTPTPAIVPTQFLSSSFEWLRFTADGALMESISLCKEIPSLVESSSATVLSSSEDLSMESSFSMVVLANTDILFCSRLSAAETEVERTSLVEPSLCRETFERSKLTKREPVCGKTTPKSPTDSSPSFVISFSGDLGSIEGRFAPKSPRDVFLFKRAVAASVKGS